MKKWLFPNKRPYIDKNKARVRQEAEFAVKDIIEYGEEADIMAQAKIWKPDITAEELAEISTLYRAAKRERAK